MYQTSLGNSIGVKPIKLECKYSNKEIDEIYHNINDYLFYFAYLYITPKARDFLLSEIVKAGTALAQVSITCGDNKLNRRKELQDKLREIYKSLKAYHPVEEEGIVEGMAKGRLARWIKEKDKVTEEESIKWMKENKLFTKIWGPTVQVKSIQDDIFHKYWEIA